MPIVSTLFPIEGFKNLCFLRPYIKNPLIEIGDFTYYHDHESVENFEKNVLYHFDFTGDKLLIGKFCMIASNVKFIMNGANHLTNSVSAYPFAIFGGDWANAMDGKEYPVKGNIEIGNDVWLGYNATIMPGVKIGDGSIVATNATVVKDVPPYSIVAGNPAQVVKMRFTNKQIEALLSIAWWNWPIEKITANVQAFTSDAIDDFIEKFKA